MQTIEKLYHLVHIWYDKNQQAKFTENIKRVIEDISDKSLYVLNFVDEVKYSKEEADWIQIIELAETLQYFVSFNYLKSMSIWKYLWDEIKWHPKYVLDYLYDMLNWKWQRLRKSSKLEKKWLKKAIENDKLFYSIPEDVQKEILDNDKYYKEFLSQEFLNILLQLVNTFNWINIYEIDYSGYDLDTITNNQERKEELLEYAKKLLWDSRIIFSWMNDWDYNHLISIENEKNNQELLEIWEKEFWNANCFINIVYNYIIIMKYERLKTIFFKSIKDKWYVLKDDLTEHIVWWEYINRCVNNYSLILQKYWISSEKIKIDSNISLEK